MHNILMVDHLDFEYIHFSFFFFISVAGYIFRERDAAQLNEHWVHLGNALFL